MSGTGSPVAVAARKKRCPKQDERLPIVQRGLDEGKSNYQIADELGCDEGTVRRDRKKLSLPPEQLAAIQEGDSAEKYLNAALFEQTGIDRSARTKLRRRLRDDEAKGKYSDPLSRALLGWLSTKKLTDCDTEVVLNETKRLSEWLPDNQHATKNVTFGNVVGPVELNPDVDRRITLPKLEFADRCAHDLVIGLLRVEPLQAIRRASLDKAIESVRARGSWTDRPDWRSERDNIAKRKNQRGGK